MEDKDIKEVTLTAEEKAKAYRFEKDALIKKLPAIKVEKEITEQVSTGEVDNEGNHLYDTKTTVQTVDSEFGSGVILSLPANEQIAAAMSAKVGDVVIYPNKFAKDFDLINETCLLRPYDIIAIII